MSQDNHDAVPTENADSNELERRKFLAGFGKAGMVALPFAAAMLTTRNAVAQSGRVGPIGETGEIP